MSEESWSTKKTWGHFNRILVETSRISLVDNQPESESGPQCTYSARFRKISEEADESITESASVYSSSPSLSRNSTISSHGTRASYTANIASSYDSINQPGFPRAVNPPHLPHLTQKPHRSSNTIYVSPPHTPSTCHFSNTIPAMKALVQPNGCFIPCKNLHSTQHKPEGYYRHHFITPVFAAAENSFSVLLDLLFSYRERDPSTPKEGDEKTMLWRIDKNPSLLTLSSFTFREGSGNFLVRKHMIETLGRRLGMSTILVFAYISDLNGIYRSLDQLVQCLDQQQNSHQCLWWTKVILVIDQTDRLQEMSVYNERKLFLVKDMLRIMDRYQLSEPLSVLFTSTGFYSRANKVNADDYKTNAQRILWRMMERNAQCGRWVYYDDNNPDYEAQDDSSSDDMYPFSTVIEYRNGKRQSSQRKRTTPHYEKLNSHPGDDES